MSFTTGQKKVGFDKIDITHPCYDVIKQYADQIDALIAKSRSTPSHSIKERCKIAQIRLILACGWYVNAMSK